MQMDREGIPFKQHVYVPEIHPLTGKTYHEREDEPHVLKVRTFMYAIRNSV